MGRKAKKKSPLLGTDLKLSRSVWLVFLVAAVAAGVWLTIATFASVSDPLESSRDASREIARELGDTEPAIGNTGNVIENDSTNGPIYGLAFASVVAYSGIALVIILAVVAAYARVKRVAKSA